MSLVIRNFQACTWRIQGLGFYFSISWSERWSPNPWRYIPNSKSLSLNAKHLIIFVLYACSGFLEMVLGSPVSTKRKGRKRNLTFSYWLTIESCLRRSALVFWLTTSLLAPAQWRGVQVYDPADGFLMSWIQDTVLIIHELNVSKGNILTSSWILSLYLLRVYQPLCVLVSFRTAAKSISSRPWAGLP